MNERIRELVNGALVAHEQDGILLPLVLEKFAQLIVRECADIAQSIGEHGYIAREEMLERFGVEEK